MMPNVEPNFKQPRKKKPSRASLNQKWSLAVRKRDNWRCQFPGCREERALDAHHRWSRKQRPDLKYDVEAGITLCRKHHEIVHANRAVGVALGFVMLDRYELARNEQR